MLITLLAGNYNSIAEKTEEQKEIMRNTWYECLKDLNFKLVLEATKQVMIKSPFPPTIADIRKNAVEIVNPTEYKPLEDWEECHKMMSRGSIMTQEEFNSHSDICKKFIGSLQQLRTYAMTDIEVINTVVKSNFLKQYDIAKKQESEDKLLPANARERIKLLQENAIKSIGG